MFFPSSPSLFVQLGVAVGWILAVSTPGLAQLTPDATLGAASSTVNSQGSLDRVEGGARAGANLFHSFRELNVAPGRSLYFHDPGVSNILTRVTGPNPSTIEGRLGVEGGANLFLLNPNGILFGPGASLDVRGSFLATTATGIKFADGSQFSATPEPSAPLLTVSLPIGLQWGTQPTSARIVNRGHLQVGQNLSLSSTYLDLQGGLQAAGNLTLLATEQVQIRDRPGVPFLAQAGGDLKIRGDRGIDILALSHPSGSLQAGGDLNLVSDGPISGDTHFTSGSNLSLLTTAGEPGTLVSQFDPILRANGDVTFGDYTGVALKVEATGNITAGNIQITGPDASIPLSDPDAFLLTTTPALILRAGVAPLSARGGNLTVANIDTSSSIESGGPIILEALNGSIQTGNLNSSSTLVGLTSSSNGGDIRLLAGSGIQTGTVRATSSASTNTGRGGDISFTTQVGSIQTGDLTTSTATVSGVAGRSGNVILQTGSGNLQTRQIVTRTERGSGAGAITLTTGQGNIQTANLISQAGLFINGRAGSAGDITLTTSQGNIRVTPDEFTLVNGIPQPGVTTAIVASSTAFRGIAGNGGNVRLTASDGTIQVDAGIETQSYSFNGGNAGNSGEISLVASGNIQTVKLVSEAMTNGRGAIAGNGGPISLVSQQGSIQTDTITSSTSAASGRSGRAGDITLSALAGDIHTQALLALARGGAEGGMIRAIAAGDIRTASLVTAATAPPLAGGNGNSGSISLTSRGGSLKTDVINASFLSLDNIPARMGRGGDVQLMAPGSITAELGIYATGGAGGNIAITSQSAFVADQLVITSDSFGLGRGGDIRITAPSISLLNGGQISTSTHHTGSGGNIRLQVTERLEIAGAATQTPPILTTSLLQTSGGFAGLPLGTYLGGYIPTGNIRSFELQTAGTFPSGVFTQVTSQATGHAGQVEIEAGELIVRDLGTIAATTFGAGNGANIRIRADSILAQNGTISGGVAAGATGNSGLVDVTTRTLTLTQGGRIQSRTLGPGRAGDIQIQAGDAVVRGNSSGVISGSGIPTQPGGRVGDGGNISLSADNLTVTDGGILSASTFTSGRSGNISLVSNVLKVTNRGQLAATTENQGAAGNISILARDRVTISGAPSGLFANTGRSSSGTGGSIFLTTDHLLLQDRGRISVASQGSGRGGDIQLAANRIELQQGTIFAETASTQGGNIQIQARDLLLLRRNSLISASAGTARAGGNGGNIVIEAGFVVGVSQENSDIRANAFTGNGGRVSITTQGLFGLQFRPQLTPLSDITASSQFGSSGTVTLNTPNVDPNRGLGNLPTELADSSQQIAQTCSARQRQNSFVVTGRGGLSPDPTEALNQTAPWTADNGISGHSPAPPGLRTMPNSVVEISGWVQTADGAIVLVAEEDFPAPSIALARCQPEPVQEGR